MKCLVVSDIDSSREEKVQFLHEMNLFSTVGSTPTAELAMGKLKKFTFDIVLLDLASAREANMDLLKWIRAEKIFVCVMMLSAENSVEYISEAFSYGVSDYILKPCSNIRFRDGILRAVSKRECLLQFQSMTQEEIDHCISHSVYIAPDDSAKKGISNETFSFVRGIVSRREDGFTVADIAASTGLSRITVRKYLDRMCESGMLRAELDYGEVGRPQKLYHNSELEKGPEAR